MTPGARMEAAIELLGLIWAGNDPADRVGDEYFRKRRYAGSGDRRAVNERVYAILRHRARLDWWIERTGLGAVPGPRTRIIAELALEDKSSPQETARIFSGATYCPEPLTTFENELAGALYGRPLNHADMPMSVMLEYPEWMDRSFSALWPERLAEEMSALNQQAPVDLRVNMLKTTPEAALSSLGGDYLEAEQTPLSPIGLRLTAKARLAGTRAFKKGWIEVQDEGSQLISLLCGARPGMNVVDFCAGGGGKALALAAAMGADGKILGTLTACDISGYRLERMIPRLQRAGAVDWAAWRLVDQFIDVIFQELVDLFMSIKQILREVVIEVIHEDRALGLKGLISQVVAFKKEPQNNLTLRRDATSR